MKAFLKHSRKRQNETVPKLPDTKETVPAIGIIGYTEVLRRATISGWTLDTKDHFAALNVSIKMNGLEIGTGLADQSRKDLLQAGHPSSDHGFSIYCPELSLTETVENLEIWANNPSTGLSGRLAYTPMFNESLEQFAFKETEVSRRLLHVKTAVVIDIQDILEFLKEHNGVTGIQRVVGGLVQSILRSEKPKEDVVFCEIASRRNGVRVFDSNLVLSLVEDAMAGDQPQSRLTSAVKTIRNTASDYMMKAGDIYFIAGAYWVVPDFAPRLNALKESGVIVGTYIYDLIPITAPEWVTDGTRAAVTDRAIDIMFLSDFFLTISEFVATEVKSLIRFETGKEKPVVSVPLPHQLPPRRPTGPNNVRPTLKALKSFVLAVGTLEGRKNHMLLFRVWAALIRKYGPDRVPQLVLVGRWGWNIDRFRESFEASDGLNGHIRVFNDLGDHELAYLYKRCKFACFVSFVEGWGLPVGEALSAGKYCLCSGRTSIPEVGGDFCDYIDPYDFFSTYEAFDRLISDHEYLAAKNKRVAEQFEPRAWNDYAEQMLARIKDTGQQSQPVVPKIGKQKLARLNWEALVTDQTIAWSDKTVKFSRVKGWSELEPWGIWAVSARPLLRFATDYVDRPLTVMIEVRLPNNAKSGQTLEISDGISAPVLIEVSSKPTWKRFEARSDLSGVISLCFQSGFTPIFEEKRDLFFGLSSIIYAESSSKEPDVVIALFQQLGFSDSAKRDHAIGSTNNAF